MRPPQGCQAVRAGATQSNGNQSNVACWFQQLQGVGPWVLEPQSDRCFPSCLVEATGCLLPSYCPYLGSQVGRYLGYRTSSSGAVWFV